MTTRVRTPFTPMLRELGQSLRVPLPNRIRILQELNADLEAMSECFAADGIPWEEARQRASEALVPDASAVQALTRLHAPLYKRVTRGITPDRLVRVERGALAAATAVLVGVAGAGLARANLLEQAAPFLWPVLGLGVVLFAVVLAKAFQLWIKGEHAAPSKGLGTILGLALATLASGTAGVVFDLYRLAGTLEGSPELAETLAPVWLYRDAALLSLAMIIALSGALGWLVLRQWVALREGAHRELVGVQGGAGQHTTHNTQEG